MMSAILRSTSFLSLISTILSLVLISGCVGSRAKKEYFYTLDRPQVSKFPKSNLVLSLSIPSVAAGYDNQRIAFREKNNELQYYGYRRWASDPAKLMREAIAAHLMHSGKFSSVDTTGVNIDSNIVVDTTIDALEEIDSGSKSYAHLAAQFRVRRKGETKTAARYFFDKKLAIEKRHPRALSEGISKLLALHCEKLATVVSTVASTGSGS